MVQLQAARQRFLSHGLSVVGVSYDTPAILRDFSIKHHVEFPLLADTESKLIRRFHALDPDNSGRNRPAYAARDMAYPGYLIVDGRGIVTEKFFGEKYTDRFTANNVMAKLFPELLESPGGRPLRAAHLDVTLKQSDTVVVPGSRVTLVVDVALPPDVHVYAPGTADFIPVTLALDSIPGFTFGPTEYPSAQMLRLEVINQTVPVYSGKFRLTRDVILPGDNPIFNRQLGHDRAAPRPLVVRGRLRYQACDSAVCYLPGQLPISWTLSVRPLIEERAPDSLRRAP